MTTLLKDTPFDPEFQAGARNAVVSCLRIQPEEKVTLITDRACLEIGAALAAELEHQRLELSRLRAGRPGAAAADGHARARCSPIWKPATSASSR